MLFPQGLALSTLVEPYRRWQMTTAIDALQAAGSSHQVSSAYM